LAYYNSGTSITSTIAPTANGFYVCGYNVTTGVATAPTCSLAGVAVIPFASNPLPSTVNTNLVTFNSGSPTAVTGPTIANNVVFAMFNLGSGLVTYSPASGTLSGSSLIPQYAMAFQYTDNTNTFLPVLPTLQSFPNCPDTNGNHLNFTSSTGLFSCGVTDTPNAYVTLTDGATITWSLVSVGTQNRAQVTLGGSRTLAFSNLSNGAEGVLVVIQPASGGPYSLTLPSGSKVVGGGAGAITLSTAANAQDILTFTSNGTTIWWTYGKNFN